MSLENIDPLLSFGSVCICAAIVGGGLKALGAEVPAISSVSRQLLLAGFGILMVMASQQDRILSYLHREINDAVGPTVVESGQTLIRTVDMAIAGSISVSLVSLEQDWEGFQGVRPADGQDGLRIIICGYGENGECPWQQLQKGGVFARDLKQGRATVSFLNYSTSPRMTFSASVSHPRQ